MRTLPFTHGWSVSDGEVVFCICSCVLLLERPFPQLDAVSPYTFNFGSLPHAPLKSQEFCIEVPSFVFARTWSFDNVRRLDLIDPVEVQPGKYVLDYMSLALRSA